MFEGVLKQLVVYCLGAKLEAYILAASSRLGQGLGFVWDSDLCNAGTV